MSVRFLNNQVLTLEGNLYSGNVSEIQQKIEYALSDSEFLIIDLGSLHFLDVAGAFMLYLLVGKAKNTSKEIILLGNERAHISDVFSLSGLRDRLKHNLN